MLILQQTVKVKWNGNNRKHYESLGYSYTKSGDLLEARVEDLPKASKVYIKLKCDYCSNTFERTNASWIISKNNKIVDKDVCEHCIGRLNSETSTKYTYEDAVDIFSQDNYTILISKDEFKNASTNIYCLCKNGHETDLSLTNFILGRRCKICRQKEVANKSKHSYEYIKKVFEDNGFVLLADSYNNNHEKLECLCVCGRHTKMSFKSVSNGRRCTDCRTEMLGNIRRTSYQDVFNFFLVNNCLLLTNDYKNNRQKLHYICVCGSESYITFEKFKSGQRCKECGINKLREHFKNPYEYVKSIFDKYGCELLTENYINSQQKLKYRCKCGNIHYSSLINFTKSDKCPNCSPKSIGEDKIRGFLDKNKIDFTAQYTFEDCKDKNKLPFDFAIFDNGRVSLIIEYDGEHHFKPIKHWGGNKHFERTKKHDDIKNNYCIKNNITLIRIPYWELNNIDEILHLIKFDNIQESKDELGSFFVS